MTKWKTVAQAQRITQNIILKNILKESHSYKKNFAERRSVLLSERSYLLHLQIDLFSFLLFPTLHESY